MRSRKGATAGPLAWLFPIAMILAVGLGAWIVLRRPVGVFGVIVGILVVLPILWIAVSALWPARAERECPACGAAKLERLDRATTVGLVCRGCGWKDESASSWLLAEEEGPLEDVVLHQRKEERAPERKRAPSVDSPAERD